MLKKLWIIDTCVTWVCICTLNRKIILAGSGLNEVFQEVLFLAASIVTHTLSLSFSPSLSLSLSWSVPLLFSHTFYRNKVHCPRTNNKYRSFWKKITFVLLVKTEQLTRDDGVGGIPDTKVVYGCTNSAGRGWSIRRARTNKHLK